MWVVLSIWQVGGLVLKTTTKQKQEKAFYSPKCYPSVQGVSSCYAKLGTLADVGIVSVVSLPFLSGSAVVV